MALVCGIDLGSFRTLSWVAWLEESRFLLDVYIPTRERPLPDSPSGWPPAFFGIDGPQGLPVPGQRTRLADRDARVPTRSLPVTREELAVWPLYQSFIEAGVELFWAVHEQELASILGLVPAPGAEGTVFETYPRLVFTRLFPGVRLPSKRKDPFAYVETVWDRIQGEGYTCDGVVRPGVDHCDAMLCALAAEACLQEDGRVPAGTVGLPPVVDVGERVLREGYIVAPGPLTP